MGRATDYSNCYIYHIIDKEGIIHYVGSTSNMNSRRSKHKYCCRTEKCKEYNFDIYKYIRDHGGFDKFEIIPIRKIENISNKTDLRIAERSEMEKFSGLKNMIGSYLTEEERAEKNIETSKKFRENNPQYLKNMYESNKEQRLEYQNKYYEENKDQILEKKRNYRETNKEKINEKRRQQYKEKKEKINEKRRQQYKEKKELEASDQ